MNFQGVTKPERDCALWTYSELLNCSSQSKDCVMRNSTVTFWSSTTIKPDLGFLVTAFSGSLGSLRPMPLKGSQIGLQNGPGLYTYKVGGQAFVCMARLHMWSPFDLQPTYPVIRTLRDKRDDPQPPERGAEESLAHARPVHSSPKLWCDRMHYVFSRRDLVI